MTKRTTTKKTTRKSTSTKPKFDVYQSVTDKLAEMLETCTDPWKRPWKTTGLYGGTPINVVSRKPYRGINVVILMSAGYSSGEWATFDQWKKKGGEERDEEGKVVKQGTMSVRKGEKGTTIVYAKRFEKDENNPDDKGGFMMRAYTVFNAEQVEGYQPKVVEVPKLVERSPRVTEFLRHMLANYTEGSDSAYYSPTYDKIVMPTPEQFIDTAHGTAIEHFHSTQLHEYIHWTGKEDRMNRDQTGRFGSEDYAYEELIAELGSAFLCSYLGVSATVREDHAIYLKNWLKAMKNDKKFFFKAASEAQKAVDFMIAKQPAGDLEIDEDGDFEIEVEAKQETAEVAEMAA
jgi:antirestriction protein ArdC